MHQWLLAMMTSLCQDAERLSECSTLGGSLQVLLVWFSSLSVKQDAGLDRPTLTELGWSVGERKHTVCAQKHPYYLHITETRPALEKQVAELA